MNENCVFLFKLQRTYGKWWDEAPSHQIDIMPQTVAKNQPQDFIGKHTSQIKNLFISLY